MQILLLRGAAGVLDYLSLPQVWVPSIIHCELGGGVDL